MIGPGSDITLYRWGFDVYGQDIFAVIPDATVCEVTEERNGIYELYMEIPLSSSFVDDMRPGFVLTVPTSEPSTYSAAQGTNLQPFQIYKVDKSLSGIAAVWAEHISYQLGITPVMPFAASAVTAKGALEAMVANSTYYNLANPFVVDSDKSGTHDFSVTTPAPFRSILAGQQGSILDVYGGGEYRYDWYNVTLYENRGADRGFTIEYGDNMSKLEAEQDATGKYNAVCPFWAGEDGTVVTIQDGFVRNDAYDLFPTVVVKVVDFTGDFETAPTEAQLRARATAYLAANGASAIPKSITVDMTPLISSRYSPTLKGIPPILTLDESGNPTAATQAVATPETVRLCDTVTVKHSGLGVSVKAKVIRTVWDCLAGRYKQLTIGTARTTLEDTIVGMENGLTDAQAKLAQSYLPLAGGNITGNLAVSGSISASGSVSTGGQRVRANITIQSISQTVNVPASYYAEATFDFSSILSDYPNDAYWHPISVGYQGAWVVPASWYKSGSTVSVLYRNTIDVALSNPAYCEIIIFY